MSRMGDPRTRPARPLARLLAASLVCALAAASVMVTPGATRGVIHSALAAPGKDRMRVAVMDFTNAAGQDLAHLGKGLQSMLITDLTEVAGFELVERARLGDIRAELELGQSELIDKKSAVRIGKLAGATHLIAGSYTVAGARMRIDARLFAVATGSILHAAKVEGEKDAFFELEKDLVKQLVGATGVAVTPKERARMGKIHTADFQAFEKFSRGIDLFDAQRYDEAVQALRQASDLDADFELARLTLTEYERLARTMRTRADAAGVAEAELARLREDQDRKRETEVVERLFAMAGRKGAQAREQRALALALLIAIYSSNYRGWEFLRRLEETGDKFTIARTRDWLAQSYWAEALDDPDRVPLFGIVVQMPPATVAEIDEVFGEMRKSMASAARAPLSSNLSYDVHTVARRLHFDRKQEAELLERLVRRGLEGSRDEERKTRWLLELAERYQDVLELDRSTRQLVLLGRMTKDAETLDKAAKRMEENRDLAQLLDQRGPLQAYVREYLMNSISKPKVHPIRKARELFAGKDTTEKMIREIDHAARQWLADDYMLLGEQPMWLLQGSFSLRTGPRADRYRAEEIRYHVAADAHSDDGGVLGVWGAGARQDFRVRFRVGYAAPRDYWLARSSDDRDALAAGRAGRARVGFLFGLRNIDTRLERDPAGKELHYPDPMTGYAVLIEDDGIALARVRAEHRRGRGGSGHRELVAEVLRRVKADVRSHDELEVSVAVEKDRVTVQVAGKSATFRLAGEASGYAGGYLGLSIQGHGYSAWRPLGSVADSARAR
jgi:TolB-like protein